MTVVILSTVTGTGIADAATVDPNTGCPAAQVCLWDGADYSGGIFTSASTELVNFVGYRFGDGVPLNDNALSVDNRTGHTLTFYIDADYRRPCFTEPPNGYRADLNVEGCADAISSYAG